jgi:hypothetical protein
MNSADTQRLILTQAESLNEEPHRNTRLKALPKGTKPSPENTGILYVGKGQHEKLGVPYPSFSGKTTPASDPEPLICYIEKRDEEEFKMFIATVYAEAANSYQGSDAKKAYELSSVTAWQAVASVIINRIETYPYKTPGQHPSSVRSVITKTGFDAYTNQTPQYKEAMDFMDNHPLWVWEDEHQKYDPNESNISKLLEVIWNSIQHIYRTKEITTDAVHYFSPRSQQYKHEHTPQLYPCDSNSVIWYLTGDASLEPSQESACWENKQAGVKYAHLELADDLNATLAPTDDFKFFYYRSERFKALLEEQKEKFRAYRER